MIQVASHHVVVLREGSDLANLVVDVARRPWEFAKETIAALDELRGNILELDLMAVTEAVLPDTTVLVKYWGPLAKHPKTKCQIAARSVIELAGTVFAVKGAANSLLKLKKLGSKHWTPGQARAQFGAGPNPGATPPPVPPPAVGAPRSAGRVNLASPQRTTHILQGDATGGGHLWPGSPGKTPFPKGWDGSRIMHEVSDIATDPKLQWIQQTGKPGAMLTKAGDPTRWYVIGERGGIKIKVVLEPAGEGIITAHPLK